MSRFETEMLSSRENLTTLMNLSGTWIDSVHECAPLDKLILGLDSCHAAAWQRNSAKFWRWVLLPVIERYRDRDIPEYFRGDAAFAIPALCRRRWCSVSDHRDRAKRC